MKERGWEHIDKLRAERDELRLIQKATPLGQRREIGSKIGGLTSIIRAEEKRLMGWKR